MAALQRVLTAHGHYLDVEPPPLLEGPVSASFTTSRLDGLQAETKFAHDAIMTRLKQASLIKSAPGYSVFLASVSKRHWDLGLMCRQAICISESSSAGVL